MSGRTGKDAPPRPAETQAGEPAGAGRFRPGSPAQGQPSATDNPGWSIFGYLLSGMAVYGGLGWLLGRWVGHQPIFLAVGMLVGLAFAVTLTILRYGRY